MHHFQFRGEDLYCEEVPVAAVAEEVGTPFYLYSHATLSRHFRVFDEAFQDIPHLICFAAKANANLAILGLFATMGGGADVVSGGELFRALRAGISPQRIVFAGVGKSRQEMVEALKADILMFNVESSQELSRLSQVAGEVGTVARVALRVNPDVDPKTHPYISTGLKKSKFGIDISIALEEYQLAQTLPHIAIVGIHQHIGSQITAVSPFVDGLARVAELVGELRTRGIDIRYLDMGGGLGIPYGDETPPHPTEMAQAVTPILRGLGCTIIFEPGRVIAGNAGILVTGVLYTKRSPMKEFVIVDAGMNDLIRPSLYGSFHALQPVRRQEGREPITVDVVGPICESGDFLAKDREIPRVEPGELLAVMSAGAYGFTMASNYNARPKAAEVLVKGKSHFLIRARESYEDLVRGEEIPDDL
ncbi:MAG: diaminopimelate decarboxylase [Candidatus Methylomirabilales bacterium]